MPSARAMWTNDYRKLLTETGNRARTRQSPPHANTTPATRFTSSTTRQQFLCLSCGCGSVLSRAHKQTRGHKTIGWTFSTARTKTNNWIVKIMGTKLIKRRCY